jgi:hypothetical protein
MRHAPLLALVLLFGCPPADTDTKDPDDSKDPDHTDDPSETDTDETPTGDLDCTPGAYTLPDPDPGTCVVQALTCGQTIEGTTVGGSTAFDRQVWDDAMCLDYLLLDPGHLDAAERVFSIEVPPDMFASVTMQSCARLDLRTVNTTLACNTSARNCSTGSGDWDEATVNNLVGTSTGERYEIIVDGYNGDEGNFRLTVDCWN